MNIRSLQRAFLAILLLGCHSPAVLSTAQEPPVPGVPQPGGAGGGVNIEGPIEAPAATADLEKMGMALPNASIIKVVLPTYQQLTGKRVILDTNIADNQVRVVVNGPISKADLVDFIERTLLVNGFVFVPTNKENTVKLINASGGVPVRGGLPVFTDGSPLPDTDAVITYVMTLDYIKPEEAVRIFPQVIQLNSYGAIASVPNASAVIISEDTAIVRQLVALKALVDVPSGKIGTKWFVLERADAEKAAEFLNDVLDTEGDDTAARPSRAVTGADAAAPPPAEGAAPAPTPGTADSGGVGETPKIKIIADIRRNSVLAVARPLDLSYIESLIKEYDSPSKARTFMKFSLKFITATEFLPTVENALARDLGDESGTGGAAGGGENRPTNATRNNRATTRSRGGSSGGFGNDGSSGFGGSSGGFGGGGTGGSSLDTPDAPPMAESMVIGKTLLVADNERNSIIVSGPPESIRLVGELIGQLDMRPRQVLLSTVVGQITLGDELEFGVNAVRALEKLNNREEFLGAGSLNSSGMPAVDDALIDFASLTDITKFPITDGLNLYGKIAGNLDVYIKMLETSSRFKVLQRPTIFTANNRKAIIQSGQRIAVPTNSFQSGANVGTTQSTNIEYRDVVLKLEVVPLINSENEVTLQISQVNDNVIGTQVIDGNTLPIIGNQEVLTTVTVTNGQTVVIGGLITERTERTINGVPVLIHIPIIKHLFGTTENKKKREELLIFIQPRILDNSEQTLAENVKEVDRIDGGEDVVEFAVPEFGDIKEELGQKETKPKTSSGSPGGRAGGSPNKFRLFGQ